MKQLELIFLAFSFLTRLPVPACKDYSEEKLNAARRYFPLVGIVVGVFSGATLFLTAQWLPLSIAVLCSMLIGVLITGVFHEDGLADTADGIGGGWKAEQKLEIMKDSRLGTYGATALWFSLSIKFFLLLELAALNVQLIAIALISVHAVSRALSSTLVSTLPYARISSNKPTVKNQNHIDSIITWIIATIALIPLFPSAQYLLPVLFGFIFFWHHFLKKQIGGYTGDTLGAAQQISEILCYAVLFLHWTHLG